MTSKSSIIAHIKHRHTNPLHTQPEPVMPVENESHGGSTWGGGRGACPPPNNFAKLSYKGPLFSPSTLKIWTFMRDFLKKLDLNLKNVILYVSFSKKVDL